MWHDILLTRLQDLLRPTTIVLLLAMAWLWTVVLSLLVVAEDRVLRPSGTRNMVAILIYLAILLFLMASVCVCLGFMMLGLK